MAASDKVQNITDESFEKEVLQSARPTLVDFWAEWCAPCRMIAPLVDQLAEIYGDRVNFCKVNIDENASTPVKFGVKGIPTLILFKDGQMIDQVVGAVPKEKLQDLVEKAL